MVGEKGCGDGVDTELGWYVDGGHNGAWVCDDSVWEVRCQGR